MIQIGKHTLGPGHPPFIVGEVGVNHNGDLETAISMCHVAKEAGCDAVKFGVFKAAEFCNPAHVISYRYQGELVTEPEIEMFRRCELRDDDWYTIKAECDRLGIVFFGTPQNESDLELLLKVGVPCVKIGSDDLLNELLIKRAAASDLPVIISTGMADYKDIYPAEEPIQDANHFPVVCVCTSEYPCPPEHANVRRVLALTPGGNYCSMRVSGFSDHTIGSHAAVIARALGACYFEKHFTLDNDQRGPDHSWSADPWQLHVWVQKIRETDAYLGHGRFEPTEQEKINRELWRRKSGQKIRGAL